MASFIVGGYRKREGERDDEGYRTYTVTFLIKCDKADGPSVAMTTAGLPVPGAAWDLGNDDDPWAYCKLGIKCTPKTGRENDPATYYELEFKFSSKPDGKACKDQQIDDPLMQPMKVSGSDSKHKEEATEDRFGKAVTNSSFEPIRGPHNEWDDDKGSVDIEQNVANLQLALCESMRDHVNATPIWGLPRRCVKMTGFTWEKKYYGQCFAYYTRKFKFDTDMKTFDRDVLDEGSKVLNGKWDRTTKKWVLLPVGTVVTGTGTLSMTPNPNPKNPSHFIRYKDIHGENTRTLLDEGVPWVPPDFVSGCAQCPDGMPKTLQVSGLDREVHLEWQGGCVWGPVDSSDPDDPTLEYSAGTGPFPVAEWIFTLGVPGTSSATSAYGGVWTIPGADWNCDGENSLELFQGPNTNPFVIVYPEGPAKIHIEKYQEADFFLLGLPATL